MTDEIALVTLKELFFKRNPMANGRRYLIYHNLITTIATLLATGSFYSAFLLQFGINVTSISILAFIPYIASMFSLLSPSIIRRLKKRRWVLFFAKLSYYTLFIGGITLLPFICKSSTARTVGFCVILFSASIIDALFNTGYVDWHIKFIPNNMRSKYFSVLLTLDNLFPYAVSLVLSLIADSVSGTPQYENILVFIRVLALVFALVDCIILLLPKEFPYDTSSKKTKLTDVFRIPFSNKLFRKTLLIMFLYNFFLYINAGVLSAYYLDELKESLTMINLTNALYGVCFLLLSGMWQHFIQKKGWFPCLYWTTFMIVPIYIIMIFVDASNALILFPILRITEHIPSVGRTLSATNLNYINTPTQDSTYYYSLVTPVNNMGALAGSLLGTLVIAIFNNRIIPIGSGINYGQFLYFLQAIFATAFGVLTMFWTKQLDPKFRK